MTNNKRYPVASQLNEEERTMLNSMLAIERNKIKKVFPDVEAEKLITDASFMRELIKKEFKRRKISFKNNTKKRSV